MTNTVKVINISLKATERDIWDFFAFSGEVQFVAIEPSSDAASQTAFVTFSEEKALDTALLLTGAVIADRPITVEAAEGFQPSTNLTQKSGTQQSSTTVSKAQDVVANLLAKGYILSKDAATKAKSFDEKHQISRTAAEKAAVISERAASTASDFDRKTGISQKFQSGVSAVSQSWKSVDEKYGVVDRSKAAFTSAELAVNQAATTLLKNQYFASGANWLSSSFKKVVNVAEEVGAKTKEKVHEQEGAKQEEPASLSHPDLVTPPKPLLGSEVADQNTAGLK